MCLPLIFHEKKIGVCYLDNPLSSDVFTEEDVELLKVFMNQAAISIENAKIYEQLVNVNKNLEQKVEERTDELTTANEQKTNFFINLAHETKTPLMLIGNCIDKFIKRYGRFEEISIIKQNIDKLSSDMVNFLDIQKLERGQVFYNHDIITNISEILNSKIMIFQETAGNKNISIKKKIKDNLFIKADPYAIDRIINNLLYNAIKYNKVNGTIDVVLNANTDAVEFIVKDTGIGISKEHLENIFKPFHQLSHEKRNIQGIKMGLYITKNIIESLQGRIDVESELNLGSTFKVTLNKYELLGMDKSENFNDYSVPVEEVKTKLEKEEYREGRKTMLLVEDNVQMLSHLHKSLKDEYNVFYALNGKEALDKFKTTPKPNIILSDIIMDIMDGYEFYEKLNNDKRNNDIPFLFLTAISSNEERLKGLEKGAIDFISKPFKMEELKAKIASILKNQQNLTNLTMESIEKKIFHVLKTEALIKDEYIDLELKCKEYNISIREKEILKYITDGKENKEIAVELELSINTIKTHIQNIYTKFRVQNKVELINLIYNR